MFDVLIQAMKPVFVSLYMVAAVAITVIAVQSLWLTHDYLSWGGVLLVTAPFVVIIGRLMIFRNTARTSARFPMLIVLRPAGNVPGSKGIPVI